MSPFNRDKGWHILLVRCAHAFRPVSGRCCGVGSCRVVPWILLYDDFSLSVCASFSFHWSSVHYYVCVSSHLPFRIIPLRPSLAHSLSLSPHLSASYGACHAYDFVETPTILRARVCVRVWIGDPENDDRLFIYIYIYTLKRRCVQARRIVCSGSSEKNRVYAKTILNRTVLWDGYQQFISFTSEWIRRYTHRWLTGANG